MNNIIIEVQNVKINITNFNSVEFDVFRKTAGLHIFSLSVSEWYEKTNVIGTW